MKRKINRVGANTLTVSLPTEWVKKFGIKQGDEVELREDGNAIAVSIGGKQELAEKTIDISRMEKHFIRLTLNNIYRLGADKLNIAFDDLETYEELQELTSTNFLGFEITRQGKGSCIIESVTEPHDEKSEVLLRRIFLIIKESLNLMIEDFQRHPYTINRLIGQHYMKVEQFTNFCLRNTVKVSKRQGVNYLLVYLLMVMEHELVYIYDILAKNKEIELSASTVNYLKKLSANFNMFYEIFYARKIDNLSEFDSNSIQLYNSINALIASIEGKEKIIVYHLALFNRHLNLLISPCIGIFL